MRLHRAVRERGVYAWTPQVVAKETRATAVPGLDDCVAGRNAPSQGEVVAESHFVGHRRPFVPGWLTHFIVGHVQTPIRCLQNLVFRGWGRTMHTMCQAETETGTRVGRLCKVLRWQACWSFTLYLRRSVTAFIRLSLWIISIF